MAVEQGLKRRPQSQLIEGGWAQLGDDRPQVLNLMFDVTHGLAYGLPSLRETVKAQYRGEQHPQAAQTLQRLIVQLACPAGALSLGGCERAAQPVGLNALGKRHSGRGAGCKRAEHLLIILGECLTVLPAI